MPLVVRLKDPGPAAGGTAQLATVRSSDAGPASDDVQSWRQTRCDTCSKQAEPDRDALFPPKQEESRASASTQPRARAPIETSRFSPEPLIQSATIPELTVRKPSEDSALKESSFPQTPIPAPPLLREPSIPSTPASSQRLLGRQSSRDAKQRSEAFQRVKKSALVNGWAVSEPFGSTAGQAELKDFLPLAISYTNPAGAEEDSQAGSDFAQLLCSLAPALLAVDSNFMDLAIHCNDVDAATREERLPGAGCSYIQQLFSVFLEQVYRPAIYSIVAAADMSEALGVAKEGLLFARAQSRTNDSNEHYYQAWQAANTTPRLNARLERLSSFGQLSEPARISVGDLADCIDVAPEQARPRETLQGPGLSFLATDDPSRDYLLAARATIQAIENAAEAATASSNAVAALWRFTAKLSSELAEEQLSMFVDAWHSYVTDAVLFSRWAAETCKYCKRGDNIDTEEEQVPPLVRSSGSIRRLPNTNVLGALPL